MAYQIQVTIDNWILYSTTLKSPFITGVLWGQRLILGRGNAWVNRPGRYTITAGPIRRRPRTVIP